MFKNKSDKDLDCNNERVLIDTPKTNDNNTSVGKKNIINLQIGLKIQRIRNIWHFDDHIELEKYFDDIVKILDFGKPFHSEALSETKNDANSIKHHEEKINELQNENKQLKDDKRTLPAIIRLNENKCIPVRKSSTDDDK